MTKTLSSPGVLIQPATDAPPIVGLPTAVTAFIGAAGQGQAGVAVEISSAEVFHAVYGPADRAYPLTLAVADYFANGGETALVVRLDGDATTPASFASALAALDGVDFNTLVLSSDLIDGDVLVFAREGAAAYVARRGAMLILDGLVSWRTPADAISGFQPLFQFPVEQRSRVAVYFPRLLAEASLETRPCAGAVAGIWARTDRQSGVWIAPAGVDASIPGCGSSLRLQSEVGAMAAARLNALWFTDRYGLVVWGALTMDDLSMTEGHVPGRRLLDHIQASIARGLAWTAVEPPGHGLMVQVAAEVAAFLTGIWQAGGLLGSKASDAFAVTCDGSNNPPDRLLDGVLRIDVQVAVVAPAEYVALSIETPVATD